MSVEKILCSKCNKYISSGRLPYHQSKCLSPEELCCSFCNLQLSTKFNLDRHLESCKFAQVISDNKALKEVVKELQNKLVKQEKDFSQALNKEKSDGLLKISGYESDIQALKKNITELEKVMKDKEKSWVEKEKLLMDNIALSKKANNTNIINYNTQINNNINQIFSDLKPLLAQDISNVLTDIFLNSNNLIVNEEVFAEKFMEKINQKIVKTDRVREVLAYKGENSSIIRDQKGKELASKVYQIGNDIFHNAKSKLEDLIHENKNGNNDILMKAHNLCDRASKSDNRSRTKFGNNVAKLAKHKTSFPEPSLPLPEPVSPYEPVFKTFFETHTFKPFIQGVRGFATFINAKFEENFTLPGFDEDSNTMLFRIDRNSEYKPLCKATLRTTISKLFTEQFYCQCANDFSVFDDFMLDEQGNKINRSVAKSNFDKTFTLLADPNNDAWDSVYNFLLCIDEEL